MNQNQLNPLVLDTHIDIRWPETPDWLPHTFSATVSARAAPAQRHSIVRESNKQRHFFIRQSLLTHQLFETGGRF